MTATTIMPDKEARRVCQSRLNLALTFLPWLLLCLDFCFFFYFVESRIRVVGFKIQDPFSKHSFDLGKFHLHNVRVSAGNITNREYVTRLCKTSNTLAIAMFPSPSKSPHSVGLGSFGRRVLDSLSNEDQHQLLAELGDLENSEPEMFGVVDLREHRQEGPLACIDRLYLIKAREGTSSDAMQPLRTGLMQMLKSTGRSS